MQTRENILSDEGAAPEPAVADQSPEETSPATAATPMLADAQITKLQNILRSMDHVQLQSVLAALEPNVLRLCLHAIFGRDKSPAQGLAAHTKILAQTKTANIPLPPTTAPVPGIKIDHPGVFRRLSPRTSTQKNAKIYCPIDETNIDCLILDTSQSGALVFLDHTGELPDDFDLFDIGDQKSTDAFTHLPHKKCRCVWRKRNKMGVKFVS